MNTRPDITILARALFRGGVAVAQTDVALPNGRLFPQEDMAMARASLGRRKEFTAGRNAARIAMRTLGVMPVDIGMGADRAPIWPNEIVASLSHCERDCIAVVGDKGWVESLGIDIETNAPLAVDLVAEICTIKEQEWLARQPKNQRGNLAKLIFSAKECAYKCQYPLTKELIGFSAFDVSIEMESQSFKAVFTHSVGRFEQGHSLAGRFAMTEDIIMTAMEITQN